MSDKKQIEEMAVILSEGGCGNECDCIQGDKFNCHLLHSCSVLYDAGYRKQKIGKWHYPPYAPFGGIYEMQRCSICGYKPDIDSENPYTKFCPECGASMKGGAK